MGLDSLTRLHQGSASSFLAFHPGFQFCSSDSTLFSTSPSRLDAASLFTTSETTGKRKRSRRNRPSKKVLESFLDVAFGLRLGVSDGLWYLSFRGSFVSVGVWGSCGCRA